MKVYENEVYGYLYDFWVYVVGQSDIKENELQYRQLYCSMFMYSGQGSWAFPVCDSNGIYYDVRSSYKECGGTIFIKENTKGKEHYFYVPWRNGPEIKDVRWITIDSEYRDDLISLLHFLVNQSPVKKLYVQIRRQGLERDNIMGMMTVDQFGEMMKNDWLIGNMVYVIYDNLECLENGI